MDERIIGRKEILPIIAYMYNIHTWQGCIKFIKANDLPLRKTPSGRPMFLREELVSYDDKFRKALGCP